MQPRKYDYDLIKKMYKKGKTYPEIAEKVGCRPEQLAQILESIGVERDRGSGSGTKKLTAEYVQKIYKLRFEQMWTLRTIAAKFDVRLTTVSEICLGNCWKKEFIKYKSK